ncbi:MAG TPA: AMP-binding protein, partial [Thermoanaerobaculia bacterium]|nr:AMP-binding protein [Thermoanaerobaculia bacterium]
MRPATVAGLLRFRAAERPERVAFAFLADGEVEAERLTYAELDRRARAIAARLRQILGPGERALLLYPPGLEFIAAFFGCLHAGVVAVPAYPPRARDRAQTRLRAIACDAEPKAALTTSAILGGLEARSDELAEMEWIATDTLPVEGGLDLPEPSPDAVAFLQYTSGSTATPKGVMVTHANLLHNERMIGEAFAQDEDSVVVGWLPLYHDMGLIGNVLQPVHAGATCVLMAPVAFLQRPARWLEAISRYRATTSGGPNFAYELCVRKVGPEERSRLDLSSWRVAFNGAEPVREATLARFAEAFGPCGFRREAFYPCYGLAEATLFVTGGAPGKAPRVLAVDPAALERHEVMAGRDEEARRLVSCGGPWEDQRVVVVEPETELECPPGRVGEIWIAGPSVARGYWRNAEATGRDFGAVLTGPPSPPETLDGPFLRTGDLGFVADGELYVTGRLKDLVIIRGRNHYPQDLELTAESSHPDLRAGSGAAFAVEVEGEERLVLVQEVERRLRGDVSEVAEAIRQAVAAEHEVQVWEVVLVRPGGVPKTSSGKVRRSACRAAYLDGELPVVGRSAVPSLPANLLAEGPFPLGGGGLGQGEGQDGGRLREGNLDGGHPHVGPPPAPTRPLPGGGSPLPWLRAAAARLLGMAPEAVALDRPLTGLGLDSLSAVELKGQAEAALGVELPLADLLQGASLGELAERLEAGAPLEEMPPLRPLPREGDQPVSFGQRSLWFLERLAPEA